MSVIKRSDLITDEAFNWTREYKKDLEAIIATSKKLGTGSGGVKKNVDELAKAENRLALAQKRSKDEIKALTAATNTQNQKNREAVKDVQNLDREYDKLSKELNDTRKAYKNLAAAGNTNTKAAKAQLAQIKKLDRQLKKIDNTVGQNQRSVGGYSNAIKGATARFLGWAAAIALVGRALIDAFRRIRQYDKAIVELSGVLRVSRKELQGLEELIISVAGASTKTSTEVAQLATTLATLGKSKEEIENLLKPVNDLSISLKATSEEAGQLLVGTLNAFQESSTEAQRYADVIANMRISTALDFEKIKDSLGFVAPTAKAVGLTIEGLGARIGVLVNNSVKASRAGRLLNSSFARLIKQGLTLEDALDLINESTDKAKKASELFGTESFSLALILASNRDKVDELTTAYQNSQGVLDELTRVQLTSLEAKLDILDSSWEALIFTITKGDNAISAFVKGTIQAFTAAMQAMTRAMEGTNLETELWKENLIKANPSLETLGRLANGTADKIAKLQQETEGWFVSDQKRFFIEQALVKVEKERSFILDLIKKKIKELNPVIEENNDLIITTTELTEEQIAAIKKLAEEREKEIRAMLRAADKIKSLVADLPPIFSKLQLGLFAITDQLFGKNTIDQDSAEFISKVDKTIRAVGKLETKEREERIKRVQEDEEEAAAVKDAIVQNSFDLASELGNRFTDLRLQRIEQELTALEFARNRDLEQAGDNERLKFEINKKFEAERKRLLRKQAATELANAVFKIALNTAIAISSANTLIPPLNIPAIIFAAAVGAAQLVAALAATVPKFDKGKERTPKDYIAGEKRPELRKSKGKWSLVNKPTLFTSSPGDKIVSGKETDSILGNMADLAGHNLLTDKGGVLSLLNNELRIEKRQDSNLAYVLEKNNADLIRTIKNKKEVSIRVRNANVTERSGNRIIHRIDEYYST